MEKLRMRVRFDYIGKAKSSRLWGNKNVAQIAEEIRQQKMAFIRNVPIQGIHVEDVDMSADVYTLVDEITGKPVAYAPVTIIFSADTLEDAIQFTMNEEFKTVQVLEPEEISLSRVDIERMLFKVGKEVNAFKDYLERKMDNWK
ncbi:MAG: hypothetical protein ACOX6I_10630 [Syntrophomonadaceae bacterium]